MHICTWHKNYCPSTATLKEVDGPQGGLCWKMNLIWSPSMKVSWSAYGLFS